ncbi:MAG: TlpA family protein disulfide reductase [Acidobacteria bacterium]|nr:TlpA family protein disulfide reductase [Acidobacteriota bacterium]
MRFVSSLALIALLSVAGFSQARLSVGSPAPQFSGSGLDGNYYDLNELKGKVVVVSFWSTRCQICHSEFPKYNKLIKSFTGQNVVFIAPTSQSEAAVQQYLQSTPLNSIVLPERFDMVLQYADRDKAGNIDMGFPDYFVIGPTGNIEFRASGWDKVPSVGNAVTQLLSKQKAD